MQLKQFWQDRDICAHEEIRIITNNVPWRSGYESDAHVQDGATAWDSSANTYDSTGKNGPRGSDANHKHCPRKCEVSLTESANMVDSWFI
jgi:hypothetical protein